MGGLWGDMGAAKGRKAFLICPVRGVSPETSRADVEKLEAEGWEVHWPPRDTEQKDPVGLTICRDNRNAILAADRVFIRWDGKSKGCLFDAGLAFAFGKPITVLAAPPVTPGEKSFQAMFRAWAWGTRER